MSNKLNWILAIMAGSIGLHWLKQGKKKQQEEYQAPTQVAKQGTTSYEGYLQNDGVSIPVPAAFPVLPEYSAREDTHGL
jgi:hypothetical protein